jgi:hypothetical protein
VQPLPTTPEDAGSTVLDHAADLPAANLAFLRSVLFDASHHVFVALLVAAVLSIGAVLLVPRRTAPLVFPEDPPVAPPVSTPREG